MLPTIVTSSPSSTHVIPRPSTTVQCQALHGKRSSRNGICERTMPEVMTLGFPAPRRRPNEGEPVGSTMPTIAADPLHDRFAAIAGARNVVSAPSELRTYECDGLLGYRIRPRIVVLPATTEEVAACVRLAREAGMPIVPRGAGTGLSGGALPVEGGIVIGTARMNRILEVDLARRRMRVQPGVINLDISGSTSRRWATTTRPIRRRRACARSAATSRRTPAARTA